MAVDCVSTDVMLHRKRHWFRLFVILGSLYAVAGFYVLPKLLKPRLERRLSVELGRTVTIGELRINPFALSATLERVAIQKPEGGAPMVAWSRLRANFDAISSLSNEWVLSEFTLDGLQAAVEIAPDGTLSFADVIERLRQSGRLSSRPGPPRRPWRVRRLAVTQARASFTDRSRGEVFTTLVGPANFTVLQFRTAGGPGSPSRFEATTESGEKFSWLGTLTTKPLSTTGEWRIDNLNLPKYAPYFEHRLNALVAAGQVDSSGRYEISLSPGDSIFRISEASATVKGLRLSQRTGGDAIIELKSTQLAGVSIDSSRPKISISSLQLNDGTVAVRREADGSFNLLSLIVPADTAPPAAAAQTRRNLDLTIGNIAVNGVALTFDDYHGLRPIHLEVADLKTSIKALSLEDGASFPVDVSFNWRPDGAAHLVGQVTLNPRHVELDVDLAGIALAPLSAYLEQQFTVKLVRGTSTIKGHVRWVVLDAAGEPEFTFTGGASIQDLALNNVAGGAELGGLAELEMVGGQITDSGRFAFSAEQLKLKNPYLRMVVDSDHKFNLLNVRVAPMPTVGINLAPAAATDAIPVPLDLTVGHASIEGGDFTLRDESTKPVVKVALQKFAGTIKNISPRNPEGGDVEMHGLINGTNPVTLTGRVSPLLKNPFAALVLKADGIDLMPLSPYFGKYAGFELERGTISIDTRTKLVEQQLDMQNTLRFEQLTIGHPTNSPDAVNLPVRLGVALLKDSEGKIVLELPVKGSLKDPHFKVTNVMGQVVSNAITRAATSPFTLIGSMFGGGGEELAQQEFVPGETRLTPDSLRRLATVQRALIARPELNLELEGGYDLAADTYALKRRKVIEQVNRRVLEERERLGTQPGVRGTPVSQDERAAMIRRMFDETFPVLTRFTKPLPPAPPPAPQVQAPAPPENRGFLQRTLDLATLRSIRERRAAEKAQAAAKVPVFIKRPLVTGTELPLTELISRLAETIPITPDDLHALADARAAQIKEILVNDGKIPPERVVQRSTGDDTAAAKGPRVTLELR